MKILILLAISNPLFAYNSDSYHNELKSITPVTVDMDEMQPKKKIKKLKRRDRIVTTEKIEDLESKYFDQVRTLSAAPINKPKRPKKQRIR